jgi:ABC-2 type transport system ATP-binding protein
MAYSTSGAAPAIRVRGLRKQYHGKAAVDGVDLDIAHGEVFALLGPNGAGKTTTVEILEGHRGRTSGEDPARADRAWRARIGIVPQSDLATGELTVREMVVQFSAFYADPRDPDEVIAAVGLTAQAGTRLRRLSGGQRRRVDVAIGIVGRPELLFLDEPTTGFDPEARRQFWELITELASDGTTILLTTHYLEEAEALAGRVGVLAAGRVVALGTPADLGGSDDTATVRWLAQDGSQQSVRTATPTLCIKELSHRFAGEITGLQVTRPSLEDRYLELIADAGLGQSEIGQSEIGQSEIGQSRRGAGR